ncbi:MAG: GNAT family N-acetyltransferase [Anaerolineales bacterium]
MVLELNMEPDFSSDSFILPDGLVLTIRPIRPDDAKRLQEFHARLSPETIYYRFLENHPVLLDKEAKYFTALDFETRVALVATLVTREREEIVGVARFDVLTPNQPDTAEAAFVIEDRFQGLGLGTALMLRLARIALEMGVYYFVFTVHWTNEGMLKLLRKCGEVVERRQSGGVYDVRVQLSAFVGV